MRKIFFTFFAIFITTTAWSLTITCQNRGDYTCNIDETNILYKINKCSDIDKLPKNQYLYLTPDQSVQCTKQLHSFLKKSCSINHIQPIGIEDGYLWYCDTDENVSLTYTNEKTDNWSYAQKRCVGSSGDWIDGACVCDQHKIPGTTLQNGECICANKPNQKYFNKLYTGCEMLQNGARLVRDGSIIYGLGGENGAEAWDLASIDRANSCQITGGDRNNNTCNCDSTLNLEPNDSKYYCNCKSGTDYINPLYKNEGCKPISEIPDYNIAQDTPETNPPAPEASQPNPETTEPTDETDSDDKQELTEEEIKALAGKLKTAQDKLAAAQETEQSFANRMLGGATMAATGLGAMQAASAYAEQQADAAAEQQMRAYLATMKCEYGGGQSVIAGAEEITLPGGNELLEYYTEYKALADGLKATKSALGLRPGIESEVLYDRAQSGLYQYASTGKTGGGYTSLARALSDESGADAAAWNEQKEESAKKLKTGAIVAGAGVVAGIAGNILLNEQEWDDDDDEPSLSQEQKKQKKTCRNNGGTWDITNGCQCSASAGLTLTADKTTCSCSETGYKYNKRTKKCSKPSSKDKYDIDVTRNGIDYAGFNEDKTCIQKEENISLSGNKCAKLLGTPGTWWAQFSYATSYSSIFRGTSKCESSSNNKINCSCKPEIFSLDGELIDKIDDYAQWGKTQEYDAANDCEANCAAKCASSFAESQDLREQTLAPILK